MYISNPELSYNTWYACQTTFQYVKQSLMLSGKLPNHEVTVNLVKADPFDLNSKMQSPYGKFMESIISNRRSSNSIGSLLDRRRKKRSLSHDGHRSVFKPHEIRSMDKAHGRLKRSLSYRLRGHRAKKLERKDREEKRKKKEREKIDGTRRQRVRARAKRAQVERTLKNRRKPKEEVNVEVFGRNKRSNLSKSEPLLLKSMNTFGHFRSEATDSKHTIEGNREFSRLLKRNKRRKRKLRDRNKIVSEPGTNLIKQSSNIKTAQRKEHIIRGQRIKRAATGSVLHKFSHLAGPVKRYLKSQGLSHVVIESL